MAILAIFVTRTALSQETAKKEASKKVTVKIVTNENGKMTVTDTTMDVSESGMNDSISEEITRIIKLDKDGNHACVKIRRMPGECNYKFDMPCHPGCPMGLKDLEGFEWEGMHGEWDQESGDWEDRLPRAGRRIIQMEGRSQSLNDLLGDIPMDRVVNYSIKDHKNGKRIIIDLDNAPMFEQDKKIIIIREPGKGQRNRGNQQRQVKVYVNSEDDDTPPPPPPPPPPPAEKK
jgi:hypothetical protein